MAGSLHPECVLSLPLPIGSDRISGTAVASPTVRPLQAQKRNGCLSSTHRDLMAMALRPVPGYQHMGVGAGRGVSFADRPMSRGLQVEG